MKKLWKFTLDYGRHGKIESVFSASWDELQACIGRYVNFGSKLGKWSEVYCNLEWNQLVELTDDQEFIEKAEEYGLVPSGYNPLEYVREEDE